MRYSWGQSTFPSNCSGSRYIPLNFPRYIPRRQNCTVHRSLITDLIEEQRSFCKEENQELGNLVRGGKEQDVAEQLKSVAINLSWPQPYNEFSSKSDESYLNSPRNGSRDNGGNERGNRGFEAKNCRHCSCNWTTHHFTV